jgi:hypothetical protein
MARFDLPEAEWGIIEPMLPSRPRGGAQDRRVLNGIFYVPARLGATCRSATVREMLHLDALEIAPRFIEYPLEPIGVS